VKTCEQYEELVSAYADGEANDEETAELFFHLGTCAACRTFLKSVLRLDSFMQLNEQPGKKQSPTASAPARAQVMPLYRVPIWKRKLTISYSVAAAIIIMMLASASVAIVQSTQAPTVINSTSKEYVYVTAMDVVPIIANPLPDKKSN
jgi:anti-sigma factor RsiW